MADNQSPMGLLSDDLTDAERKYFETGGESGLPEPREPREPREPPEPPEPREPPDPADPELQRSGLEPDDDDDEGEPQVDPRTGKALPRRIPLRKFRALEERYQTTNRELSDMRARLAEREQTLARADERMQIINEALSTQQPGEPVDEDPMPDPRQDVFAYLEWSQRENARRWDAVNEQILGLSSRSQEFETQQQQTRETQQLDNAFRTDAAAYARSNPNFARAYVYLVGMRDRQYEALGLLEPAARNAEIIREERNIVRSAYQNGVHPADRIYQLALASGFDPQAAPAPPASSGAGRAGAAPSALPPGAAPSPNVADEIAAAQRGLEASRSLSLGGGAPPDQLTPETLAAMPQEAFNRLLSHLERTAPERLRQLLPGA